MCIRDRLWLWVLSLSPLDIIAQRLPPEVDRTGIRSLVGVGRPLWPPRPSSRSTPCGQQAFLPSSRPYLNRFRGEPAISRLDWPFTPTHKSSERFSTHTGSGLHCVLPQLHPAHG